jgi:hypothetical protein
MEIVCCPSDKGGDIAGTKAWKDYGTSYGANVGDPARTGGGSLMAAIGNNSFNSRRSVKDPARTILLAETGAYWTAWRGVTTIPDRLFWHTSPGDYRWNTIFADGHGEFLRYEFRPGQKVWSTATYTFDPDL